MTSSLTYESTVDCDGIVFMGDWMIAETGNPGMTSSACRAGSVATSEIGNRVRSEVVHYVVLNYGHFITL